MTDASMSSMREIKLCLLGDTGVGKTSVVQRFVLDSYNPGLEVTIGASFMSKTLVIDDRTFRYQIWDTAGQEKYRSLAPMYYRGSAAAIIVYDITNEQTFKSVKGWIRELRQQGPKNIVIAIAGNKIDLEDEREVVSEEAKQYCDDIGAIFLETSAVTAIGVDELFHKISEKLPTQSNPLTLGGSNVRLRLETDQETNRKKCSC